MVHQQRLPVGLVHLIEFYEPRNQLFVGGKEGVFILDLHIKFKYDASMAILLDAKGSSITVRIKEPALDDREISQTQKTKSSNEL